MSAAIKTLWLVWVFGTAIGLVVLCQPSSEEPIAVSVKTAPQGGEHEQKVILKATVNGRGVSHGEVKLNFAPTSPKNLVSFAGNYHSIKGYTDSHGVFVSTWAPSVQGEYMIAALVSKPGCADGQTACFLRVPEPKQERRLTDGPISIRLSNQPER
jgi:hypothetical protein